jgi:O-antigen/teichoic acid export membrane protein
MREMARDRENVKKYFWNLVALRFLLGLLGLVYIPLAARITGFSEDLLLGVIIYTSSFLLSAFSAPLAQVLVADERLGITTVINVISQIVFMIFGAIFLFSGYSYVSLIITGLIAIVPRIVIGIWAIKRLAISELPFRINVKIWPALIKAGLPFGIISLMLSISYSIDTVILNWYHPPEIVGWYSVAYGLVLNMMVFFSGFKEAIVPTLSKVFVRDPVQVERWYHGSVRMIMLISFPIAVGGMMVAFPLIQFLYTVEFLPSALAFQILIWDVPLVMFAAFCGNMTTITGEERSAARINTINTIANVGLNLYFIPRFGLVGAALITVLTDLISALQFHFLLRQKLHLPNITVPLLKTLAASLLMAIPVYFARDLHVFFTILIGGVTYVAIVILFRLIGPTEWAFLQKAANKIGAGRIVRIIRQPHSGG